VASLRSLWILGVILGTAPAGAAPEVLVSTQTTWFGMCDASAAVALDTNFFAVANDEDNALRIFQLDRPGLPVQSVDLSRFLGVDPKKPETDLEGAAWLGDTIFWIGSHGQNRTGKYRTSRHRLFATRVEKARGGVRVVPVGAPYSDLLFDLLREPRLRPFKLETTLGLPPKAPGALNIEGLCSTPATNLLIGFRNPIPRGRALIVPVLNPFELIRGRPARLGDPILLDLAGRGIRDLAFWRGRYVIIAGSFDGSSRSRLYLWDGGQSPPERMEGPQFKGINPEAVVVYPEPADGFQLLSDDGTLLINGVCCKDLPNRAQKRFRGLWLWPQKPE
jgi:hypothetical protein